MMCDKKQSFSGKTVMCCDIDHNLVCHKFSVTFIHIIMDGFSCSKQHLTQPAVVEKLRAGVSTGKHRLVLDSACYLLNYVGDVVAALCPSPPGRATSPPWEGELPPELDSDWTDDLGHDDDESGGEDSVRGVNVVFQNV
jgi:hypothetical protein